MTQTSENMMDDLETGLCEVGIFELIDYINEFVSHTAANAIAWKELNRMWRFIAMMAAHWEGAIFCENGCHMLLNPTKLQKENAHKDAWCCDRLTCEDVCTCNIPKCLKTDDELQEERIGGFPAFQFLAIDFRVPHENELAAARTFLQKREPNIDNVFFESWPLDDVVAIRFAGNSDFQNELVDIFGPRNLRLLVASLDSLSEQSLVKCLKLRWFASWTPQRQSSNEEKLRSIVKFLPNLKRLSLGDGWRNKIPDWILRLLRANESIEGLSFQWNGDDDLVKTASSMKNLVSLSLPSSPDVSDKGVTSLVQNATPLKSLNINDCNARIKLTTIAQISSLLHLDARVCAFTDEDLVETTGKFAHLQTLKLSGTFLANKGITALGKLTSLRCLAMVQIQTDRVHGPVINGALRNLTQLRVLNLSQSPLESSHLQFLSQLTELEVLYLERCNRIDDAALSHLRGLTKLRKLHLCCSPNITSEGVAHLSNAVELESLDLSYTKIDDEAMFTIGGMHKMRWLTLRHTAVSVAGLDLLLHMPDMELLDVDGCHHLTVAGLCGCVARMNRLKYLQVCSSEMVKLVREQLPYLLVFA